MMMPGKYALIVAGGMGNRMNSPIPKQFLTIGGYPILFHTLKVFSQLSPQPKIFLVLPANEHSRWQEVCKALPLNIPHTLVNGGETRFQSVKNGLAAIEGDGLVAIHDGVRPLVSSALIEKCYSVANQKGNAIPAVKPHESIRHGSPTQNTKQNRDEFWLVQTPQVFYLKDIKNYYQIPWQPTFTDDASVAENHGVKINIVEGERNNIKITSPDDLLLANAILENRNS